MLKLLPVVFFMFLTNCVTRGKDFNTDVSWIKPDVTKKSDVKMVLGEPYQTGYGSGMPTWIYGYYRYRLFGESHTKELKFYWSENGTVSNISMATSFPNDVKRSSALQKVQQKPD